MTASPLLIFVSLAHFALCGVAVWKWKKPFYRLPPFLLATAEPFILGWENILTGIITMNLLTAAFLVALRIEEIWPFKRSGRSRSC
jgi:hypothetical protein